MQHAQVAIQQKLKKELEILKQTNRIFSQDKGMEFRIGNVPNR